MQPLTDHYRQIAPSLPKVLVEIGGESPMVGTGICIGPGKILTCAHVVLGRARLGDVPAWELSDWRAFRASRVRSTVLIDQQGAELACEVTMCDPALDIAVLSTSLTAPALPPAERGELSPGTDILYYGYPYTIQNAERDWPFSVFRGTVSARAEVTIGGTERRAFAVVQGLVLGGVSGGPVFDAGSGALLGMINGQMNWGRDDVLINERDEAGNQKVADTDTPLPVGFATSFTFLRGRGFDVTSLAAPA